MTQILVDRGFGAAGVAIAPAPVKGIFFLPFSTLRVSLPALSNPANNHRALPLTPEQFHYAFTNNLSEEESLAAYNRYACPAQIMFYSRLPLRTSIHMGRRRLILRTTIELRCS